MLFVMRSTILGLAAWCLLVQTSSWAAERVFDFGGTPDGQLPKGFRSTVSGQGKPGDWRIVWDEVPPLLPPLSSQAPVVSRRPVLAQMAQDPTDEHFPLLIFDTETFGDFKFSTRVKTVKGTVEQMAGIVFRLQNETNFYVLRASSLGGTFRFYKVVNGQRGLMPGPSISIPSNVWHEISVECAGNQIRCFLNGNQVIPTITDNSFSSGKVGFWTKSDSVSYFSDARITYTQREPPLQGIIAELSERNSRLLGLKVYMPGAEAGTTKIIASKEPAEIGQPGGKTEREVITKGETWYGKEKKAVSVIMPLRDRNGEIIAAARVVMRSFAGQTERNAIERAAPIVRDLQRRFEALDEAP